MDVKAQQLQRRTTGCQLWKQLCLKHGSSSRLHSTGRLWACLNSIFSVAHNHAGITSKSHIPAHPHLPCRSVLLVQVGTACVSPAERAAAHCYWPASCVPHLQATKHTSLQQQQEPDSTRNAATNGAYQVCAAMGSTLDPLLTLRNCACMQTQPIT